MKINFDWTENMLESQETKDLKYTIRLLRLTKELRRRTAARKSVQRPTPHAVLPESIHGTGGKGGSHENQCDDLEDHILAAVAEFNISCTPDSAVVTFTQG